MGPRQPASCIICVMEPRAPDVAIMEMGLNVVKLFFSTSDMRLMVSFQTAMTLSYLSSSVRKLSL